MISKFCLILMACSGLPESASSTALGAKTQDALHCIIGEHVLSRNGRVVVQHATTLPAEARYARLRRWVLPSGTRQAFRCWGEFSANKQDSSLRPNNMVVAIHDLIRTAQELRRLSELRTEISAAQSIENSVKRQQAAILFLVDIARSDMTQASTSFAQFVALLPKTLTGLSVEELWPVLLVVSEAVEHPALSFQITEFFGPFRETLQRHVEDSPRDVLFDHLCWLDGYHARSQRTSAATEEIKPVPASLKNWGAFSYKDAKTIGQGRPQAHWRAVSDGLKKIGGHEMDYLMYRLPLQGNYQVECDVSFAAGVYGTVMVAGSDVQPISSGSAIQLCDLRRSRHKFALPRRLSAQSSKSHWMRYRGVIRDNLLKVHLNGRLAYERKLHDEHDPWIGVRSWRRAFTEVRDVRITGSPNVPNSIHLTADPALDGWTPYFTEGFGPQTAWRSGGNKSEGELIGERQVEFAGTLCERMIHYHRPLLEDGRIDYEFFYDVEAHTVHPVLGDDCFLMVPDGVLVHRLSAGPWGARREPVPHPPAPSKSPEKLPLLDGVWNQVSLTWTANSMELRLNNSLVHKQQSTSSGPHKFGLYHDAGHSEARVRNVVWHGEWPTAVPNVEQQELRAITEVEKQPLESPSVFHHHFCDGAPSQIFDFVGDETLLEQQPDGIRMHRSGRDGTLELRLCFRAKGDFDFEARFRSLETNRAEKQKCGIGLMTFFQGDTEDDYAVFRRPQDPNSEERVAFAHKRILPDGRKPYRGSDFPEESSFGRLKVSRRGSTMYAFYAEEHSPNFRLVDSREVTDADVQSQGFRLVMQAEGSARSEVVWQEVTLRADEFLDVPPTPERELQLLKLFDLQRSECDPTLIDFTQPDSTIDRLTGSLPPIDDVRFTEEGLRVISRSTARGEAIYQQTNSDLADVVDIETTLQVHEIATPDRNLNAEVALLLHMAGEDLRYVSIQLRRRMNSTLDAFGQTYERNAAGKLVWRPLRAVPVHDIARLRLVMHEQRLFYLYSETADNTSPYRVLTQIPLPHDAKFQRAYLRTEAVGADGLCDVTWKTLQLHTSVGPAATVGTTNK